jgi:hypothetical protein
LLLYEYCTEAEYHSFINAKDTVLSKWETLVEKALNIVHLFYFLQYNGSNLVGGIGMLEKSVSDAFEIEFFSDQGHLIGEEGELNSYGLHTVRALTDACLKGYNGEGPWKEFPKSVFETFMGIVKNAFAENAGGPPVESTWVEFFCNNIYPELLRGVLLKHHPDQDSYVKPSVVVDVIRKALQREEEQVAPMEETKDGSIADEENADGASQDHPTESIGNPLEGTKTRENNMKDGLIAEEENEGGAPPGQGTGPTGPPLEETQAQENNMKDGSIVGGQNAGGAASGQPTEPTGASSEKTQAQKIQKEKVVGSNAGEENEGGAAPRQLPEPTEASSEHSENLEDDKSTNMELQEQPAPTVIDVDGCQVETSKQSDQLPAALDSAVIGIVTLYETNSELFARIAVEIEDGIKKTQETDSSLTPFPINEVLRDKILKQLALVVGTDRCQLELYVPNEILTLTDEEEKQWNDKKKAAAEYAVECTIEDMSVDDCEEVKKVTKELTHFYTCLTENLVFDMGMRAGYGNNSNKCVCPCW